MTETEWLACTDPRDLLSSLTTHGGTRRQWLFGCACCRAVEHLLSYYCREAIEVVERYADGAAKDEELFAVFDNYASLELALDTPGGVQAAGAVGHLGWRWRWRQPTYTYPMSFIVQGVARAAAEALAKSIPWREARQGQCDLLRDVLRNPDGERMTLDPNWLAWNGGTIPSMAKAIYEDRAFDQMTILADALEDAGCADQGILSHCRSERTHVRGCWLVDALLGKE